MNKRTTTTVTREYDDQGRVIKETTVVVEHGPWPHATGAGYGGSGYQIQPTITAYHHDATTVASMIERRARDAHLVRNLT
jgi:hypothetical protein